MAATTSTMRVVFELSPSAAAATGAGAGAALLLTGGGGGLSAGGGTLSGGTSLGWPPGGSSGGGRRWTPPGTPLTNFAPHEGQWSSVGLIRPWPTIAPQPLHFHTCSGGPRRPGPPGMPPG